MKSAAELGMNGVQKVLKDQGIEWNGVGLWLLKVRDGNLVVNPLHLQVRLSEVKCSAVKNI